MHRVLVYDFKVKLNVTKNYFLNFSSLKQRRFSISGVSFVVCAGQGGGHKIMN